jgi:hypothetical protein
MVDSMAVIDGGVEQLARAKVRTQPIADRTTGLRRFRAAAPPSFMLFSRSGWRATIGGLWLVI